MRLRYDEATDSVVVVEDEPKAASPKRSELNPTPEEIKSCVCFHDPEIGVYEAGGNYPDPRKERPDGAYVVSDIDGYRTAAGDVANGGKQTFIGSRSRHREFLRDNRLVEVGNDYDKRQVDEGRPRQQSKEDFLAKRNARVEHIKHALDLVKTGRVNEHYDTRR